jgi:Na+-driven multidrug efflux pump
MISSARELAAGDIWLAIVLGHATRASLSVYRFRQGKWRDIQVARPKTVTE